MKVLRFSIAAATAVGLVVVGGPSASATAEVSDNAVAEWNLIAVDTLVALPGPAGGAPPASQINMGMVQGAVYDAVNAIGPKDHRSYLLKKRFSSRASDEAAVATAAYRVLADIVSSVPASISFQDRPVVLGSLATHYAASLAAIRDTRSKQQGIGAGNAAADAMIAARRDDGRFSASPWVPNSNIGHWQPLTNTDGTPQLDPTPWVGQVTPFLVRSASQFRTEGPYALDSAAYAADFKEVKSFGSLNSTTREPDQTHIALFWQSNPVATWNSVARDLVSDPRNAVDLADSARLFAIENLSAADAAITCWNDKYYWDFWRPADAIHRAGDDNNSGTEPDPDWAPLLTAPYPEHPSGHLCLDSAHLRVLRKFFGTDRATFTAISSRFPGETRSFDRFSQALAEITEARIWAGLHFRNADLQSQILGRNVADYVARKYFQPVGSHRHHDHQHHD